MPLFFYESISSDGKSITGSYTTGTSGEVEQWLQGKGQHPVVIRIAGEEEAGKDTGDKPVSFFVRIQGIGLDDRILFCRQVATMLDAGVPILQALHIMAKQSSNPNLIKILKDVANRVEEGSNLSDSFAIYPRFASTLFFNIVKVGEETGTLDRAFLYLSELYENEKEISEKIKAATRYPKIVISAMFAAVLFLMSFVVPKFIELFKNSKVELPLPTRVLIFISDFAVSYFWLILFVIVAGIFAYRFAMQYDSYRIFRDRLWLRIPIFGDLSLKIYMSRFCRVFSVLLKSGVNVIQTLELASTALENLILFNLIENVTSDVRDGNEMHESMGNQKLFPEMVVQMMAIGEQSGQVDEMMDKVADYYDKETNYTIANLSTLLEPILLLFMGVMVGFLALAIYMPMWDMMNVMKGG